MEIAHALDASCRHCGTSFTRSRASDEFCCTGCATVYQVLQSEGLGSYYDLRASEPPACPVPARVSSETYAYCDDPELIRKFSPDGRRLKFFVEGLDCTACLWLLEKLPSICPDAASARVNMSESTVEVEKTTDGRFSSIARTLNRLGHRPHPLKLGERADDLRLKERRRELVRIGVAGAATGNLMIMAVALYAGADQAYAEKFRWVGAALATPVLTYCAWPFYKSAISAVRNFRLNIDVPIVAAIWAGIAMSLWGLASGAETLYFDSLSMLTLLLLSSRFFLAGIQRDYLTTANLEDELLLSTVTRLTGDGSGRERVSSLSIAKGDRLVISGDMGIPADGRVVSGDGVIDTAVMTGEADPISVRSGTRIEAGSRNLSGEWVLEVDAPPAESRLAGILAETEESAKKKSRMDVLADHVAQWFVGLVLLFSVAVAAWFVTTNPAEGLSRALALTIVTCPCVFGMAIPLSMSLAVRAAARRGIVIKDADAIERLWKSRLLFFDKTGTLTKGEMTVVEHDADPSTLEIAAALEENQPHPVAKAIRSLVGERSPLVRAVDVTTLATGGVEGTIAGVRHALQPLDHVGSTKSSELKSSYGLFREGTLVARFEIGDGSRPEAARTLAALRAQGYSTRLLSGDRDAVVRSCASALGFPNEAVISRATPESKSRILKDAGEGSVMIGDGANDAAALAAAHVGIAMRGSMEASLRAADVYLLRPDLAALPDVFRIAKSTKGAINRNLAFSVTFNLVAGALALQGSMTPLLAAVLMPLSSLTVLLSALATGRRLSKNPARRLKP